jgi:hypothetical protein
LQNTIDTSKPTNKEKTAPVNSILNLTKLETKVPHRGNYGESTHEALYNLHNEKLLQKKILLEQRTLEET